MLRKVILSGELARKFGREFTLDIQTPAEAIRALCANFRDFRPFLSSSEQRGVAYKVIVDGDLISRGPDFPPLLHTPFSRIVRIVPVIAGAKGGFLGALVGASLIGASFFLPGAPLIAGIAMSSLSSIAFGIGTSMLLGSISSLLAPTPSAPRASMRESVSTTPSSYFNGVVNTTAEGQCVPLGYGRGIVGSHVVSAGITADDYTAAGVT